MKKILWVCNTPLPEIQHVIRVRNYNEGWLVGISNQLRKREDIVFHYVFRQNRYRRTLNKTIDGITFWGVYDDHKNPYEITKKGMLAFESIIKKVDPDIIHIFGTEYSHSLECVYSVSEKKKIIVSIQGLTSELAKVYMRGIPLKDRLPGDLREGTSCLLKNQFEFYKRGKNEKKLLQSVTNVIGRTDWDRKCIDKINPKCRYFHCNETLRDVFYDDAWDINKIQRYSIFISQANYPIKGLHILISAMPLISKSYPDVRVYVAGDKSFMERNTPYGRFIKKLVRQYHAEEKITFLGFLSDEKIKHRLLKSHVMLMPSLLENSPNSIGEAMLLGTPVVASCVGGIPSVLHNGTEGYLYQCMDKNELAEKVCKIFSNDDLALGFSKNGQKFAETLYNKSYNLKQLLKIYDEVMFRL